MDREAKGIFQLVLAVSIFLFACWVLIASQDDGDDDDGRDDTDGKPPAPPSDEPKVEPSLEPEVKAAMSQGATE